MNLPERVKNDLRHVSMLDVESQCHQKCMGTECRARILGQGGGGGGGVAGGGGHALALNGF